MNGFLVAGTNSGSGKTTVTIGLMALLKSLGKEVSGFKTGPDYIDPMFHKFVLDKPSYNLDTWMNTDNTVRYLFKKHAQKNDVSIVEGVMGMYDGFDANDFKGSGYHVAKTLNLPVILVIDGSSMASSIAAIANGFADLMPDSHVKGVIINNVASDMHYHHLSEAMNKHGKVPCIGYVKRNPEIKIHSRHLGLIQAEEIDDLRNKVDLIVESMKETINIDQLLEITQINLEKEPYNTPDYIKDEQALNTRIVELRGKFNGMKLGVAKDKAFTFYYEDNLDLLEEIGVELKYFSPMDDEKCPDVSRLYLGGGYPEVYGKRLEENKTFRSDLKQQLENNMPALCECGGLMYLMDGIKTVDDESFSMLGFYKGEAEMTHRLHHFGYVESTFKKDSIVRAHEFHKSVIHLEDSDAEYLFSVTKKARIWQCGIHKNKCVGTYSHVHFYSNLDYLEWFLSL